ncbi:response regulator transcription factor [uncultured Paludibaculum sp.]|uniref:response regulator transcription factor n=1 Tax=uncultured Paludibaculum sp. TaxID=1765020 RepID=UPI002AAC31D0|nr:response regulator transcription factor [uncultured Paludibaculum sp.]
MPAAKTRSVIIAEELALFRDGIAAVCELSGRLSVVGSTSDGEQAWKLVEERKPDVVLVDLQIPQLHSLEIAKRLAEAGERDQTFRPRFTRCVILAMRRDRKTVLEVLRAGAQGYLLKTSTGAQLIDCVEQVIEGGIYVSPAVDVQSLFAPEKRGLIDDPIARLSAREFQVFSLLVEGVRAKEIAARLQLSPKTVDTYRSNLMKKLDIHDIPGLVKFAIQHQIIPG